MTARSILNPSHCFSVHVGVIVEFFQKFDRSSALHDQKLWNIPVSEDSFRYFFQKQNFSNILKPINVYSTSKDNRVLNIVIFRTKYVI